MNTRGFTILELMVATGIGAIVVTGVFMVMTNQTNNNMRQGELVEAQQNARAALTTIVRDVSQVGFGIPGKYAFGTSSVDNYVSGEPYPYGTCQDTDVLTLRYRDPNGFWSLQAGSTTQIIVHPGVNPVSLTGLGFSDNAWAKGELLLIYPGYGKAFTVRTDAARSAVPPAGSFGNQPAVALLAADSQGMALAANIVVDSDVHVLKTVTYRIICGTDAAGNQTRALIASYDFDSDGNGVINQLDIDPIASDIEDMQVEFLYDNDNDGLPDVASPTTFPTNDADRERVKALRISLVARTSRPMTPSPATMLGTPVYPLANRPVWASPPGAPPYPILYRYGRRMLRETVLLVNRNTADPSNFGYISNRYL